MSLRERSAPRRRTSPPAYLTSEEAATVFRFASVEAFRAFVYRHDPPAVIRRGRRLLVDHEAFAKWCGAHREDRLS